MFGDAAHGMSFLLLSTCSLIVGLTSLCFRVCWIVGCFPVIAVRVGVLCHVSINSCELHVAVFRRSNLIYFVPYNNPTYSSRDCVSYTQYSFIFCLRHIYIHMYIG